MYIALSVLYRHLVWLFSCHKFAVRRYLNGWCEWYMKSLIEICVDLCVETTQNYLVDRWYVVAFLLYWRHLGSNLFFCSYKNLSRKWSKPWLHLSLLEDLIQCSCCLPICVFSWSLVVGHSWELSARWAAGRYGSWLCVLILPELTHCAYHTHFSSNLYHPIFPPDLLWQFSSL